MTGVRQTVRDLGKSALAALDGIDVEEQSQADPQLSQAVEDLVRLRDELIERQREGDDCGRLLGRVNGMLSGVFGAEYPVTGIQWPRIAETRDELRDMLGSLDESHRG